MSRGGGRTSCSAWCASPPSQRTYSGARGMDPHHTALRCLVTIWNALCALTRPPRNKLVIPYIIILFPPYFLCPLLAAPSPLMLFSRISSLFLLCFYSLFVRNNRSIPSSSAFSLLLSSPSLFYPAVQRVLGPYQEPGHGVVHQHREAAPRDHEGR
jgi:hypothetical protein